MWTGFDASFSTAASATRRFSARDVEAFLTHLAVARNVSASTQNQAKSAILFLYREVLGKELP